ncbi:hypothetical protein C1H46_021965 [Malus baccata]|uniref:Uncharacterized protein n=1 Tax=Malus baccata TaxID=106549 RepID=A0A540M0Z0_MALBA|nr:hypothetical protein C1H46_021965 [Malus baccata]
MRQAIGWRGDRGGSDGRHGRFAMAAPYEGRKEGDGSVCLKDGGLGDSGWWWWEKMVDGRLGCVSLRKKTCVWIAE